MDVLWVFRSSDDKHSLQFVKNQQTWLCIYIDESILIKITGNFIFWVLTWNNTAITTLHLTFLFSCKFKIHLELELFRYFQQQKKYQKSSFIGMPESTSKTTLVKC